MSHPRPLIEHSCKHDSLPLQIPAKPLPQLIPLSCDGCGACCQGIGSPVLEYATRLQDFEPPRPAGMPQALIDEINFHFAGLLRGQEPQDQCLWFDQHTRRCRHYEFRPQICRDYELGGTACLIARETTNMTTEHAQQINNR